MEAPSYAVVAVRWAGKDGYSLLADAKDRVVVFDSADVARDFVPLLRSGLIAVWTTDRETCHWLYPDHTFASDGMLSATIDPAYDVYDTPVNSPAMSEARGLDWKHHCIWSEWLKDEAQRKGLAA